MSTPSDPSSLLRVEKGHADPEELAAITAVLLARAAGRPDETPAHRGRTTAGWRRLERQSGFRPSHSWQG
ncbi:acyl-CoA carboxylase subunit epsilon [Streptomyces peucetius]|uniref:Acyl-CoA carboxylase subunit epsilon n=1 Tax=Streptomyces peucetius TaxID=1950 RepID=A0ABY6IFJ0_STRPE|nr:acyl-CoA carboxylase subunit epsilon [Streptomyces peucetius]UYQ64607.1 acyl-CoA carboxylase subunit epsilon [Streptomyces peucetius]